MVSVSANVGRHVTDFLKYKIAWDWKYGRTDLYMVSLWPLQLKCILFRDCNDVSMYAMIATVTTMKVGLCQFGEVCVSDQSEFFFE